MEAGKGGVRFLSLVAIMLVMFRQGVAQFPGNPCYAICFQQCTVSCFIDPFCIATCAYTCGLGNTCSSSNNAALQNNDKREEANANHFCKLGCASSVCSTISTTLKIGFSADHNGKEAVKGSVELCNNACSGLCNKHAGAAVLTA